MWDMRPRRMLVAAESADCEAALQYAAREARRRRCGVHLVHVAPLVHGGLGRTQSPQLLNDELHRIGTDVLNETSHVLRDLVSDDDLPVSTELCHGDVVPNLVTESSHACLVVVQHREMGPNAASGGLSVTSGVAARAHAPVVAIPAGWRPPTQLRTPVVTVGVPDVETSAEIVRIALEEAIRADARLRLVHAYDAQCDGRYGGRFAAYVSSRRVHSKLSLSFGELFAEHPEVRVEITITRDPPADALLRLAAESDVVVVGRGHPRTSLPSHLGPVTRAVLRGSPVPVLVVDPVAPDDRLRGAGDDLSAAAIP
jgi:nucleotide-binding universal stress UspA family protein